MREIKNVFVDGIALVSKKNKPAVEKAESKFAIFKTVSKKDYEIQKLKENIKKIENTITINELKKRIQKIKSF